MPNTKNDTGLPVEPNWVSYLARQVEKRGVVPFTVLFTLFAVVMSTVIGELTFFFAEIEVGGEIRLLPVLTPAVVAPSLLFFLFYVLSHLEKTKSALRETLGELEVKRREAEQANVAKSEFLTNMSHEFRTPLNAVIGFSHVLENEICGPVNAEQLERIGDIRDAGNHLLNLISDLLDFAKIEAGEFEADFAAMDVARAIDSSFQITALDAEKANIRLSTQLPPELPPLVADQRIFKQMLINLISNAIKFTPAGGSVVVAVSLPLNGGMQVEVCDSGIGMAEEEIPIAIATFGQIDSSLSRRHEGTGLGLPLVNSFMALHGGSLEIESELGGGTMARLLFPAHRLH